MRLNIRTKLLAGFLAVVGLLLIISVVSYVNLKSLANGAQDIANSASLDDAAMSMNIALLRGMDVESRSLIVGWDEEFLSEFQASVDGFDEGEDTITALGTDEQRDLLQEMAGDHENFQEAIMATITLIQEADTGQVALQAVNTNVQSLFDEAATVVQLLVSSGVTGGAVDQAGAQRMRAFKLAYMANVFATATTDRQPSIANELQATATQFSAVQAGLRSGDAVLGLSGTADLAILAQLGKVDSIWGEFSADVQEIITVSGKRGEARANSFEVTDPIIDELLGDLSELEEQVEAYGASVLDAANSAQARAILIIIVLALVSTVVAVALGLVLSQSISKGVGKMTKASAGIAVGDLEQVIDVTSKDEIGVMATNFTNMIEYLQGIAVVADKVADGDLTVNVTPKSEKDALGTAFYRMVNNLNDLIGKVDATSNNVGEASQQLSTAAEQAGQATQGIASTTQQVARGAEEQTTNVQETTKSMQQLSAAIDQIAKGSQEQAASVEQVSSIVAQVSSASTDVAKNAQAAAEGAQLASNAARSGSETVSKTIEGMGKIGSAVDLASSKIAELGKQSAEIGNIVSVIDDIAAQTNLLALNAAIEAARAGEQGRGFAVVADEVRKLAERVTEATKEIANLIETIQTGVAESVVATEQGAKEVVEGRELAGEAGVALNQIIEAVQTVAQQIEQISAAAEEVSASAEDMVKTVNGVSAIVEQNSAATQQMAANSTQVDASVEAIANITQQNSAATQEVSATAEEMSAQVQQVVASSQSLNQMAQDLSEVVSKFKLSGIDNNKVALAR